MRIVRTVGQAFEVCHKLVSSPVHDHDEDDEDVEECAVAIDQVKQQQQEAEDNSKREDVESCAAVPAPAIQPSRDEYIEHQENVKKTPPPLAPPISPKLFPQPVLESVSVSGTPPPPGNSSVSSSAATPHQVQRPAFVFPPTLAHHQVTPSRTPDHYQPHQHSSSNLSLQQQQPTMRSSLEEKLRGDERDALVAQIRLLKEQLAIESNARIEAQVKSSGF